LFQGSTANSQLSKTAFWEHIQLKQIGLWRSTYLLTYLPVLP